jgi:hypothetical protein
VQDTSNISTTTKWKWINRINVGTTRVHGEATINKHNMSPFIWSHFDTLDTHLDTGLYLCLDGIFYVPICGQSFECEYMSHECCGIYIWHPDETDIRQLLELNFALLSQMIVIMICYCLCVQQKLITSHG